jgi:hypothetical protein
MSKNAPPITVRDVTDRAAALGHAIVTYHVRGASLPWRAEVVAFYLESDQFGHCGIGSKITPQRVVGRGVDCEAAIKALGVDF